MSDSPDTEERPAPPTGALVLLTRRREKCLTQAQLAKAAGLSTKQVNRIERGHSLASNQTAIALARVLGGEPWEYRDASFGRFLDVNRDLGLVLVRDQAEMLERDIAELRLQVRRLEERLTRLESPQSQADITSVDDAVIDAAERVVEQFKDALVESVQDALTRGRRVTPSEIDRLHGE